MDRTFAVSGPTSRITPKDSVIHAFVGGEAVLLDVESGLYFGLDEVGARIWQLLVAGASEESIVDQLLEEYDVERSRLRADVTGFLTVLVAKGLTEGTSAR